MAVPWKFDRYFPKQRTINRPSRVTKTREDSSYCMIITSSTEWHKGLRCAATSPYTSCSDTYAPRASYCVNNSRRPNLAHALMPKICVPCLDLRRHWPVQRFQLVCAVRERTAMASTVQPIWTKLDPCRRGPDGSPCQGL